MSILETILEKAQGPELSKLADKLGLDPKQVAAAAVAVVPRLQAGLKKNAASPDGAQQLAAAVDRGDHDKYLDSLHDQDDEAVRADGNKILGHVLGSKDASRQVAAEAAAETGIEVGTMKKMLPVFAGMSMGAIKKQVDTGGQATGTADTSTAAELVDKVKGAVDADDLAKLPALAKKFL